MTDPRIPEAQERIAKCTRALRTVSVEPMPKALSSYVRLVIDAMETFPWDDSTLDDQEAWNA